MRRAARYLAISSKKSLCALKKNDSRGANSSTSSPRSMPHSTYSMPSRSVNASSCSAVEPGFADVVAADARSCSTCGTCRVPNSIVSTTSRIDGRGGKMYSFCAMYSLRMSFCSVPHSCVQSDALLLGDGQVHRPEIGRRRVDGHRRRDVAERDAVEQHLHVGQRGDATPHLPTSPARSGWSAS